MNLLKSTLASLLILGALPLSAQVLYKVEGNGLKEPSYIFGTHHLAPTSVIESFGASAPFNSATQIVGEIDMTQNPMEMQMAMQPYMIAPADSTLSKVISPEDFSIINEEFKKYAPMPGMELSMLDGMKPMVVSTIVTVGITSKDIPDYDPNDQLDTWFQKTGANDGKRIISLETAEQQAALLFGFTPISVQAEALVEMLKDTDKAVASAKQLTEAYMNQDLAKMMEMSEKDEEHPEFMEALIDRRNADWLTKLPTIFNDGPTFVAVGALHLPGEKGVLEGLRRLGYTVTPLSK